MTVLPMLRATGSAGGWHAVTAPGGYEIWQVTAANAGRDVQVIVGLGQGYDDEPAYRRRYARYRRRPTRVAPPLPGAHAWAALTVVRGGRVVVQWTQRVDAFAARREGLDVRGDRSRLMREADGSVRVVAAGGVGGRVELVLDPPAALVGRDEAAALLKGDGARHQWSAAAGLLAMRGEVANGGGTFAIEGTACIDHAVGTGPLAGLMRWWMRGRVMGAEGMLLFLLGPGRDGVTRARVIEAGSTGVKDLSAEPVRGARSGRRGWLNDVRIGAALHLSGGRLIDRSGGRLRVCYDATTPGGKATAVCEIVRPRRWCWPL